MVCCVFPSCANSEDQLRDLGSVVLLAFFFFPPAKERLGDFFSLVEAVVGEEVGLAGADREGGRTL